MGLIECASANSLWRGYDYFQDKKVTEVHQTSDTTYCGMVTGSNGGFYIAEIDLEHPRKSTCTCPHAAGRRIVCKHQIAVYFTVFPKEAERIYREAMEYEEQEAEREALIAERLASHIHKMKKAQLEEALLHLLRCGPDWQYDQFVRDYMDITDLDD